MRVELRGLDVRVAEELPNLLEPPRAPPGAGDEVRRARVPEVVEAHVARDAGALWNACPALDRAVCGSVVAAVPAERVALRVEATLRRRKTRPTRCCAFGRQ